MALKVLLLALILYCSPSYSAWSSAKHLKDSCQEYLQQLDAGDKDGFIQNPTAGGYCFGVVESIAFTLAYMKNEGMLKEDIFCPPEASLTDLMRYIVLFIHKNPEVSDAPAAEVVQYALTTDAFKC